MATCVQEHQLVDKAIYARIPHGVEVEGTVFGVELLLRSPSRSERFVRWMYTIISRMRKKSVALPQTAFSVVKFCSIKRINFDDAPPGDGRQLDRLASVHVNNLDGIVTEAICRGYSSHSPPLHSPPFNARARFYANGALTVTFLSLTD